MGKVRKPSDFEYCTPSSEPFRFEEWPDLSYYITCLARLSKTRQILVWTVYRPSSELVTSRIEVENSYCLRQRAQWACVLFKAAVVIHLMYYSLG
jgi:hypothetical protein